MNKEQEKLLVEHLADVVRDLGDIQWDIYARNSITCSRICKPTDKLVEIIQTLNEDLKEES